MDDAKLGAAFGIHPVANGNNGIQVSESSFSESKEPSGFIEKLL